MAARGRPRKIVTPNDGVANPIIEPASDGIDAALSDSGYITIDPLDVSGATGSVGDSGAGNVAGSAAPKRGRKPGTRQKSAALDINGVEALLITGHMMLAAITKIPEINLDKVEANALAVATANVARHYDVTIAAKSMDWMALFTALGMVYVPRVMAVGMRNKQTRAARTPPRPQTNAETIRPEPAANDGASNIVNIPGVGTFDIGG